MPRAPHVVVIGGGATGVGVARDLALRGVDVTLLEKGGLTHGTTGRMHGLLHSGARYAVADPASAEDCIAENEILRSTARHCVEDTGGLFVRLPEDDPDYLERKLTACRDADIPAERLTGERAREMEPHLSPEVQAAIRVPDAAIDPFRLVAAAAGDAADHGARVETHSTVTDLVVERGEVVAVDVEHGTETGERVHGVERGTERIPADHVVNATGAWAGQIAALADCEVGVTPAKGAMVVTNVRQVDTVINRCRPKGDADILVPHETTAILGTTDEPVDDPESFPEERREVELLIDELAALVPLLAEARTVRSFWGVRPLYDPSGAGADDGTSGAAGAPAPGSDDDGSTDTASTDTGSMTRDFAVLDHASRDGVAGLTTVVGGKFTTYRLMAEAVADAVCGKLGVDAPCRTAERPLPGSEEPARLEAFQARFGLRSPVGRRSEQRLGTRADAVLGEEAPNPLLCTCEAVTRAEVADAVDDCGTDLQGVRIRTRATMGTCQGGTCIDRVASVLHPEFDTPAVDEAREDLTAERWKGLRHALWGDQLAQAALNQFVRRTTYNHDADPVRHRTASASGGQRGGTADDDHQFDVHPASGVDVSAFDAGPPGGDFAGRAEHVGGDDGDSE